MLICFYIIENFELRAFSFYVFFYDWKFISYLFRFKMTVFERELSENSNNIHVNKVHISLIINHLNYFSWFRHSQGKTATNIVYDTKGGKVKLVSFQVNIPYRSCCLKWANCRSAALRTFFFHSFAFFCLTESFASLCP